MNTNTPSNVNKEIMVIDENQIEQFRSLYFLLKGKRDTDIKLFTDFKQFKLEDLNELNEKIYNVLKLHKIITDIIHITVGLDNKEIRNFGSWDEFVKTDWNIAARTKYITIEWDFNLMFPNQKHNIPQGHAIKIRIGNNLKPSEMIQVVFQGDDEYDIEEAQSQMSCKIDFINNQICSNLKTAVTEWYDALPKNSDDHKAVKFILRNDNKIQSFIKLSLITSCIILLNYLYSIYSTNNLNTLDNNRNLFLFITISFGGFYLFYSIGSFLSNRMMDRQIRKLRRDPMFEFTKGDRNTFLIVKKENKDHLVSILFTILIGISTNALTYLIGYIIELIKS